MTAERAAEIIAAYGADAARWPADERAACEAAIALHPALCAARARAARLDRALTEWARAPLHSADSAAAPIGALVLPPFAANDRAPVSRGWRPLIGLGLAASLAAGIALTRVGAPPRAAAPMSASVTHGATIAQADADSALFRTVFTPTPDEEDLLS